VINAYWHQRFQQCWEALRLQYPQSDQRLLASKVSTASQQPRVKMGMRRDQRLLASKVSTEAGVVVLSQFW